ncbi:AAR2 domain-containing protein [Colletotrichum higginsianum]|nr:AAR2 domain-containing protein [Colletotrichum higginsianum]
MHLGNEACIQQWWHMLVSVVLKAYTLPLRRPELARFLLQTITAQLVYNERYLDGSVLDYGPSYSRDLRMALIVYKRRLNEVLLTLNSLATPEQAAVGQAFSELETWVWKFGWDIRSDYLRKGKTMLEDGEEVELEMDDLEAEDERGEFAATVVELDESGKQKDLVSWD